MLAAIWSSLWEPSSLWIWEIVEVVGAVVVTVGVIGEYVANFTKLVKGRARKKLLEKRSTLVLIVGLAIELVGLVTTLATSNVEIQRLLNANLELKKQVLALELGMQPRTIHPDTRTALINCLKGCPKGKVFISAGAFDGEATAYAGQIEDVLTNAGFEVVRPTFPSSDAIVSVFLPGLHIVVKDPKHPPIHAGPIQHCFGTCGVTLEGAYGDFQFDSNRVEIAVGQHF